ncbi:MAG: DUF2000 domain-containing protein [Betaproteobacteria bacterium]|nr:DUF2000 family protein [Betaproteobacteria bacterium]MBU6512264.1 DUF2000 family protein [Betaproteobacteria bacterium]MDE1956184.1 DUF2000 domain-containing protein [Betaproteobacteria bacterium]MDE2152448.1 DUF2000 domain-containing protein [Betaproteobacteria bacterium]
MISANIAYENTDRKFVGIVNRKHALPTLMNALAHTAFGISGWGDPIGHLLDYQNESVGFSSKIDESPFIILEARHSNHLRALVSSVSGQAHLRCNAFTTSMIGRSASEQLSMTRTASADQLDFVAVVLYGPREHVEPLTRRFSLYRG